MNRLRLEGVGLALGGRGLLLVGPSGSGRSDLALRLIDGGALLVSDEQVDVVSENGCLLLAPPAAMPSALLGRIEARGIGILSVPLAPAPVPLALIAEMTEPERIERLPPRRSRTVLGAAVPLLHIAPFQASATAKLRLAMRATPGAIMPQDE